MSLIGMRKTLVTWCSSRGANFKINQARSASSCNDDPDKFIRKSVFISQSTDVFTNLALEDWLYRNFDFTHHHVLMFWRNDPCVVIGRHQNPWIEHNVKATDERGIKLVRRNSGGGTVYHDSGNINLTFFTPRERYSRRYNLDVITRALYREWGLKASVNKREDIVLDDEHKISGTAAKLGRPNAYHHCTLLVGINKCDLGLVLEKQEAGITTNATTSIRSPVKNLMDVNPNVRMNKVINAVGWEYLRTKALVLEDGGHDLIQRQKGFQLINPTEDWFPGIDKLINQFHSWDWNYGMTPKFTVTRVLDIQAQNGELHRLNLTINVQNGMIEEIRMSLPAGLISTDFDQDASVITNLHGTRYDYEVTENLIAAIGCKIVSTSTSPQNESNMVATQ